MRQQTFSPTDYTEWRAGYHAEARKLARQDRDAKARRLKENGYNPRRHSFKDKLDLGGKLIRTTVYVVIW
jgi:mRNA-degrading endonuclease RelE of RelBE toxin-antitoxin system